MKIYFALTVSLFVKSAAAFSAYAPASSVINLEEYTERDVWTMDSWATEYGVQRAEGVELTTYDGVDYSVMTQADLSAGSPVLCVPEGMVMTSSKAAEEFGGSLAQAEQRLVEAGIGYKIPGFHVFCKIIAEYEKGDASPWYPWLNSLPRRFNTGAAMTYACFACLPPYAAWLCMSERVHSVNFQKAIQTTPFSEDIKSNTYLQKWAYNVMVTRSFVWNGEKVIAPMADMLNHGSETEAELSLDEAGNCMVYATRDVPAGSPVRISLGDSTNPSPIFATYGFLDESAPATFCKLMDLQDEMQQLGYDFSDLLFYKDTGDIAMPVYDTVLYSILMKNDPGTAENFAGAVRSGDEATKSEYHGQYFPYTKEELQKHVDSTLRDIDGWMAKASSYDPSTHPRAPLILQHNEFVKETFSRVKQNLDNM